MKEFQYRTRENYYYLHSVFMDKVRNKDKDGAKACLAEMRGMKRLMFTLMTTMNPGVKGLYEEMASMYRTCLDFIGNMD